MKTIIDFEKDNLFDYFVSMGLGRGADNFIEQYAKSDEEKELLYAVVNKCLQIRQQELLKGRV